MSEQNDDAAKPKVPPPTLRKGPSEPPPPSTLGGKSDAAPPPAPPASPPASSTPGAGLPKVRVKPGSEEDEDGRTGSGEPLVPLGTRVGGFLIDLAIALGLYIGAVVILPGFLEWVAGPLALAYILLRDGLPFLNGQSVGKTAMKTKAVTLDGRSLSGNWQPVLVRNVVLLIPVFPLVELIVLLTREDRAEQGIRLGDEWAKTKVIPVPVRSGDAEDGEVEAADEDETRNSES